MNEDYETSIAAEINVTALNRLVLQADFVTIRDLQVTEHPQSEPGQLALLNVSGRSENPAGGRAGFCAMLVGKDSAGEILWACCLTGQHQHTESRELFESLLVAPEVVGRTSKITIRLYGQRFPQVTPSSL
jgi:hypothetical protein